MFVARVFSQKHSLTYVGNGGIYSVDTESVYQIWQTEYFVGISWEGLTHETLTKTSCLHRVLTLRISVMCRAHASLHGKLTREIPMNTTLIFNCLKSTYSFSLSLSLSLSLSKPLQINPTWNIGYIRLNKITIEFGTE